MSSHYHGPWPHKFQFWFPSYGLRMNSKGPHHLIVTSLGLKVALSVHANIDDSWTWVHTEFISLLHVYGLTLETSWYQTRPDTSNAPWKQSFKSKYLLLQRMYGRHQLHHPACLISLLLQDPAYYEMSKKCKILSPFNLLLLKKKKNIGLAIYKIILKILWMNTSIAKNRSSHLQIADLQMDG